MNRINNLAAFCLVLFFGCFHDDPGSDVKIVGGQDARGDYQFFAGIYQSLAFEPHCGGALIAPDFVLTAAHCVHNMESKMKVVIGSDNYNLPNPNDYRNVIGVSIHPNYDPKTLANDIALLFIESQSNEDELPEAIEFSKIATYPQAGEMLRIIGNGNTTSFGALRADRLLEVDVPVLDNETCQKFSVNQGNKENVICAGNLSDGGIDSCQGDSGGPLFRPSSDGQKPLLLGLVSWGTGCAQPYNPGHYTMVARFQEWIENEMVFFEEQQTNTSTAPISAVYERFCYKATSRTYMKQYGSDMIITTIDSIHSRPLNVSDIRPDTDVVNESSSNKIDCDKVDRASFIASEAKEQDTNNSFYPAFVTKNGLWARLDLPFTRNEEIYCKQDTGDAATDIKIYLGPLHQGRILIGLDLFYLTSRNDQLDSASLGQNLLACGDQSSSLSLYQNNEVKFLQLKRKQSQTIYQLQTIDLANTEKPVIINIDSKTNMMSIRNNTIASIFTWKLSCPFSYRLQDSKKMWYSSEINPANGGSFTPHELLFTYAHNAEDQDKNSEGNGKIGGSGMKKFTIDASNAASDWSSCTFNNYPVSFQLTH